MNGNYQKDWNCKKYCGKPEGNTTLGYHGIDCPKNPVNVIRYGKPEDFIIHEDNNSNDDDA